LRGGAAGYIAEFKNAKWGLSQEDISVFNQYDEATKRLSQTIQNDLQKAFITLLPAIMAAGNAFSAFVSGGSNFIKEMSRGISEGATEIRNIVVGEQAAQGFLSQTNRSTSRTTTSFQNAEGFSTTFRKKAAFISQAGFAGPSAGAVSATAGLNAAINNAQNQINVLNNSFNSLVNASNSAARSLDNMSKLKDLFGLNDQQSGSSYISNALKKKKQFSDPEFNSILNELSDFIGSGGSSTDSFFKNRIEKLKGLSGSFRLQQNLGLIDQNTTNTGMEAAIKAIENAAGNINKSQEVRVKISVDKSGVIQTVVDSDAFVRAVIDQAVAAADTSARAATR
jgi:prefoldin subunit 5